MTGNASYVEVSEAHQAITYPRIHLPFPPSINELKPFRYRDRSTVNDFRIETLPLSANSYSHLLTYILAASTEDNFGNLVKDIV